MTTQFYFVRSTDHKGESLDVMVEARNADEARDLWVGYYYVHPENISDVPGDAYFPEVFAVPALTGTPHPLFWNQHMQRAD